MCLCVTETGGGGGGGEPLSIKNRKVEREGELSVMLSVSGAGCDKRGSMAAVGIYLSPLLSLPHTHTHTHTHIRGGGEKDPVVFPSATHE